MDAETRQYFEALRSQIGGLHGQITSLRDELRGEIASFRDELRGEMTSLRDGLRGEMISLRGEIRAVDAKVDRVALELRRHFDVTAESLRDQMKILAEGVVMNAEALSRFRSEVIAEVHEIRRGR